MPARIIVWFSMELSSLVVIPMASMTVISPPRKPMSGSVKLPMMGMEKPDIIVIAASSEAPEDTPSVYDEARGLRSTDCITVPPTASAAPVMNAIMTRGTRIDMNIDDFTPERLPWIMAKISPGEMLTLPTPAASTRLAAHTRQHIRTLTPVFMTYSAREA